MPMIGFDAEAVAREFGLADDEVPVMLLRAGGAYQELALEAAPVRSTMCWTNSRRAPAFVRTAAPPRPTG